MPGDDARLGGVEPWICPECGRPFARPAQGHDCAPGLTIEEYFETGPALERPIFDAVMRHVRTLGPVYPDPVSVGIFLKNPHKFAELRTMTRWVAIGFSLRRRAQHPTITRQVVAHGHRYWHVANVAAPEQLDDELLALLTEAYGAACP